MKEPEGAEGVDQVGIEVVGGLVEGESEESEELGGEGLELVVEVL